MYDHEDVTLESFIRPPLNVWHTMDDSELLWRASMEPRRHVYPFKRVPKLAFMFLTKGPLPFAPLWEMFFKGHEGLYSIYVHALPNYRSDFEKSSVFYRRYIPSCGMGEMSMCEAERRLLANALLDISNECFMGCADEEGPDGRGRYRNGMEPEITLSQWRKGSQCYFGKADVTETFLKNLPGAKACFYNDQKSPVCYLFARKFAPSALEPLLELAPKILGF
ncbi:hypothetical protein Bca52824_011048 [Brassica carinata]|uniref:Uncharacterized protein n=1 Tax=Brassica carinata TaxID=52824 RepID=A0A8X7WGD2_BRACI|nr:hypothetical protein Bca52824_011048 [Brassica carinata]